MISITNLSKQYDQRTLFKDVTLSIFPNEKIGLAGPNGSGKSTLFSILLGEVESTAGAVQMPRNLRVGYLPQEAKFDSRRTVLQEMTSGDERIRNLMRERGQPELLLEVDDPDLEARLGVILRRLVSEKDNPVGKALLEFVELQTKK